LFAGYAFYRVPPGEASEKSMYSDAGTRLMACPIQTNMGEDCEETGHGQELQPVQEDRPVLDAVSSVRQARRSSGNELGKRLTAVALRCI
jgi:hypothetical protein